MTQQDPVLAWPVVYGAEVAVTAVVTALFWRDAAWWRAATQTRLQVADVMQTSLGEEQADAAVSAHPPQPHRRRVAMRCGYAWAGMAVGATGAATEALATWGPLLCGVSVSPLRSRVASGVLWIGWWLAGGVLVRLLWAWACSRVLLGSPGWLVSGRYARGEGVEHGKQAV